MQPGCSAQKHRTGAAPAVTRMAWTCRPAPKRCGWIFRDGLSPLPRCGRRLRILPIKLALQQSLDAHLSCKNRLGKTNYCGIGLASPAFISNRSPGRGRKAILKVTATEARGAAFALKIRGF